MNKRIDELIEIMKEYNHLMNVFMNFMITPTFIENDLNNIFKDSQVGGVDDIKI